MCKKRYQIQIIENTWSPIKEIFFFFDVMLLSRLADLLIVSTVIGKTMFVRMNSLNHQAFIRQEWAQMKNERMDGDFTVNSPFISVP